jgi:hypothetical protein
VKGITASQPSKEAGGRYMVKGVMAKGINRPGTMAQLLRRLIGS